MKELQLRNRQRERALNTKFLREICRALLEEELALEHYQVGIQFISAGRMAEINQEYLGHEGSTDVITFDYRDGYEAGAEQLDLAGEIYISPADARKQAREFKTTWQEEIVRYIAHGMLHLRGYDDLAPAMRKEMKREENRLVRRMNARFEVAKVAG